MTVKDISELQKLSLPKQAKVQTLSFKNEFELHGQQLRTLPRFEKEA